MSATLHLAPVGQDKTGLTLALLKAATQSAGARFPKIWALTATRRQELNFRDRLIASAEDTIAYFNIEIFNFYALNAKLLQLAGTPVRRLNKQTRFALLRALLAQLAADGELRFFQRIAEKPGFIAVLADLINELKQNHIDVEDFAAAAENAKDRDIATIYRRYQDTLRQSELADVEGEGWLALATLRRRPDIAASVDLLLVDGYDQFTPVQAQLLAELSRSVKSVHCNLSAPAFDLAGAALGRSELARKALADAFADAGVNLVTRQVAAKEGEQHADLLRLAQVVFSGEPAEGASDAIRLIAMPNETEEARAVLRAVKAQLLAEAKPDDILIAIRDWGRYASYLEMGKAEYDLPLLFHDQPAFAGTPLIAAILDLLRLAPRFRRLDLLDVLRSPYIDAGLNAELIDLLDKISREQQFTGGSKEAWLETIRLARRRSEQAAAIDGTSDLTSEEAERLNARLSAFMDAVTPPQEATISEFIHWLSALLGVAPALDAAEPQPSLYSLNIGANVQAQAGFNPAIVNRDIRALYGLSQILRDMLASDDTLRETFGQSASQKWERFASDLRFALESASDDGGSLARQGQVLVTTAVVARGLPHAHVYILGLSEGIFPAEAGADPLYLDSERKALQARGIPLVSQAERADDQGLFYELIGLPRQSLTLSRPAFTAGKVWIESHFWRAVRQVFPAQPVHRRPAGAVIDPMEAANVNELMLALADQQSRGDATASEGFLSGLRWLRAQPERKAQWLRVLRGRDVESARLSIAPFDHYSGVLSHQELRAIAARSLGAGRSWSATSLKDYGLCAFRFFAKRLLKLEEAAEPEAGVDALQLGSLNHRILEETYRRIRALGLPIQEQHVDKALAILADVAEELFERAPDEFNFRATATWEQEKQIIFKRLRALVKLDFSPASPLNHFGGIRQVERLEQDFSDIMLELPDGAGAIRMRGIIDRIDLVDDKLLVLVDYKTGTTRINRRDMEEGRDFQMLAYSTALESMSDELGAAVGGMFWHIRDLKPSGLFDSSNDEDIAALERAREHIARNLQMGRAGQFPVQPNNVESGKCARYCEFSRFCRMQVTNRYKAPPP